MTNICSKDIYLIFLTIVIIYLLYKDFNKKEGFDATSDMKAVIGQVYNADIEAIRNLSSIAAKLQAGGLTVPGNLLLQSGTVMDFASNDTTREPNAGKIGYNVFDDSLNIVGKGKPGEERRTTLWENLKVTGKIATNNLDPNNMPDGWGGGLRIFDGYASGTMGFGPDGKSLKAYINSGGDALVSGSLNCGYLNTGGGTNNNPGGKNAPWGTHFPYKGDGNNYIRGNTIIDGNTIIEGFDLRKLRSMFKCAGFAIDGDRTTMLLYEGNNKLNDNANFDGWTCDRWDLAWVNRGWEVVFYDGANFDGTVINVTYNKDSDVPVKTPGLGNRPCSYTAAWKGW
jgi:hypothetical protein